VARPVGPHARCGEKPKAKAGDTPKALTTCTPKGVSDNHTIVVEIHESTSDLISTSSACSSARAVVFSLTFDRRRPSPGSHVDTNYWSQGSLFSWWGAAGAPAAIGLGKRIARVPVGQRLSGSYRMQLSKWRLLDGFHVVDSFGILCGPMGKRMELRAVAMGRVSMVVLDCSPAWECELVGLALRLREMRNCACSGLLPHTVTPNRERFRGLAGCMMACMVRELVRGTCTIARPPNSEGSPTTACDARHMHGQGHGAGVSFARLRAAQY